MSEPFNPYAAWLGWSGESKTPNYFQLLGLELGEEDPKVIVAAADRAASRVRRFRPGENAGAWASLLDELAAAKQCLIDPSSRREYLQTLRSGTAPTSKPSGPSSPAAAPVAAANPGLYPPGFPGAAPSFDPMAAMPLAIPGFPQTPGPSPYAPSPYSPYQPFDPAAAMQPLALPAAHQFSADPMAPNPMMAHPMAPSPMAPSPMAPSPMAPSPMAPSPMVPSPMAPSPMAPNPMAPAPVPMAIPLGASMAPYSASASPAAPAAAASLPGTRAPSAPSFSRPTEDETNRATVAVYSTRQAKSRVIGPILVGAVMGLALLGVAAAAYHYFGEERDQEPIAAVPEQPGPEQPFSPPPPSSQQPLTFGADQPAVPRPPTPPTAPTPSTETKPEPSSEPEMESTPKSTTDPKPESMPEPAPKPEPKSDPKPEPKPATAEVMEGIPQPTAADLTKLGKALQKARDAIGEHDFERAAAFLDVASEMPRLPEHQAMIDRLKVFGDSVQQYRAAIQASIDKLESGSSFEVGSANVGVVETGPDKVIFRVAGQNRTYTIREMPVGLAAALAAQSIAPEDPNTLTLKGAFVLASPKAKDEDLTKAREFLEKGAASVDAAKDLLLLLKDNYALKAP